MQAGIPALLIEILRAGTLRYDPGRCGDYLPMKKDANRPRMKRAPILWLNEVIEYLGLDQLGLARPDKAIYRLIEKGALHPKKIAGRYAFDKAELDMLVEIGEEKRKRGRPRVISSA